MSGFLLSSTTSPSNSQPGSRSASRSRTYGTNPNELPVNDTAGNGGIVSPPATSTPQSRSESPARVGRSGAPKESSSRSSSRQRITNAVKSVFSSHAPPQDLSFADGKGLERQAREASASRSRNASRAGSRSNSRAPSPTRGLKDEENGPNSSSRSSSRSRIGAAVYKALGGHEHHLQFADERGLQRQAREAEKSSSRSASRNASRSASRVRGEPITEEESDNRGRHAASAEYHAVRA